MQDLEKHLITAETLPYDKSWIIRMGVFDLLGYAPLKPQVYVSEQFLEENKDKLSDDLLRLIDSLYDWQFNPLSGIRVGEAGTLYRILRFAAWKLKKPAIFQREGTLKDRPICNDPEIVNWPLAELLTLDHNTSQWATAAVLLGNKEQLPGERFKLDLTYEAIEHWTKTREKGLTWVPRYDDNILLQARAFLRVLNKMPIDWTPRQAEDYCFPRAFNLITPEQGAQLWPSLIGHESNRITQMERALQQARETGQVTTRDHRTLQAIDLLYFTQDKPLVFSDPTTVSKSWPIAQYTQFKNIARQVPKQYLQ